MGKQMPIRDDIKEERRKRSGKKKDPSRRFLTEVVDKLLLFYMVITFDERLFYFKATKVYLYKLMICIRC